MKLIRRILSVTFPLTHQRFCLSLLSALHWVFSPQVWTVRIRMRSSLVMAAPRLGSNYWNGPRSSTFLQQRTTEEHPPSSFTCSCATGQLNNNSLGSESREVLRHRLGGILRPCPWQRGEASMSFHVESAHCSR